MRESERGERYWWCARGWGEGRKKQENENKDIEDEREREGGERQR